MPIRNITHKLIYHKQHSENELYEELFEGWKRHLKTLYGEQIAKAKRSPMGLVSGTRLTHHGRDATRPRWVPTIARKDPRVPEITYHLDDGHHRAGFHRMPAPAWNQVDEPGRELFVRTAGGSSLSFDKLGAAYFNTLETHKRIYSFADLSRLEPRAWSPDGDEPERHRLTEGLRALDPDVRRDGKQLAYSINRRGTQFLAVSDVNQEGGLETPRVLFPTPAYQLAQVSSVSMPRRHYDRHRKEGTRLEEKESCRLVGVCRFVQQADLGSAIVDPANDPLRL